MAKAVALREIIDNRALYLDELRRRQAIVRDYTRGVARGYATGL